MQRSSKSLLTELTSSGLRGQWVGSGDSKQGHGSAVKTLSSKNFGSILLAGEVPREFLSRE